MSGGCKSLEDTERTNAGMVDAIVTPQYYECMMNNPQFLKNLRSVHSTCYWNTSWFNGLNDQAQSIISYMEENFGDILSQE